MNKINLFLEVFKQHKKMVLVTLLTIIVFGLVFVYFAVKNQQTLLNNQEYATKSTSAYQDIEQQSSTTNNSFLGRLLKKINQENEQEQSTDSAVSTMEAENVVSSVSSDVSTTSIPSLAPTSSLTSIASNSTVESTTESMAVSTIDESTAESTTESTAENTTDIEVLPIVIEDQSTPETIEKAKQFAALKSKCPVTTADFEINFSYSEDKFNVFIVLDREAQFWKWIGENYPTLEEGSFSVTVLP